MKILLVDDEIDCIESIEIALSPLNHEVTKSTDPIVALNLIKEKGFDLVISDIKMPGMTGIDLLKEIKKFDKNIAVIIMTAYGDLESAIECINNKAYAFFPKPLNIVELISTIKQFEEEFLANANKDRNLVDKSIYSEIIYSEYEKLKEAYFELLDYFKEIKKKDKNEQEK